MENILDISLIKRRMLRKYPAFGSTIYSIKYEIVDNTHGITTAATDNKTIFVNADFVNKLTEQEQVFVFAHEVCHIALNHIMRSKGKNPEIWNVATDAVINQHLKNDGLPLVEGCVNIPDALSYDAEELYEKLLQKQNEQQKNNQTGHDNHTMWQEVINKTEQEQSQSETEKRKTTESGKISEKNIFEENEQEKIKRAEETMKKINSKIRGDRGNTQEICLENIGSAKTPIANWKKILKRNLEIEDEAWGHKFSDKNNGYSARIEDIEYDEKAETEIILDTSGSVNIELLKNFLRQVKSILKNSKIKVGTFSDSFHGWVKISKEKDIDDLTIIKGGFTNFNDASKAFTKRKDVNKICFTDGQDGGNANIEEKRNDIVWICFENRRFKPDFGKVIFVPKYAINFEENHRHENEMIL